MDFILNSICRGDQPSTSDHPLPFFQHIALHSLELLGSVISHSVVYPAGASLTCCDVDIAISKQELPPIDIIGLAVSLPSRQRRWKLVAQCTGMPRLGCDLPSPLASN